MSLGELRRVQIKGSLLEDTRNERLNPGDGDLG
jgi:hypothetical protein